MAFRRRDRDQATWIRWGVDALAVVAVLWAAGLFWYAHKIAQVTPGPDRPQPTDKADAVVVLTGSTDRLTQGFELLQEGRAQRLFISGVYRGIDVQQILRALRRSPNEAQNPIVLGYGADDTVGNAQETSVWMAKEGLTSLILVTSNFHMPRALVEFHAAMPQVRIVPHATASASFRIDDWWWWPGTIKLIASEWTKYVAARTTLALNLRMPRRAPVSPAPMDVFPLPEPAAGAAQPSADPTPPRTPAAPAAAPTEPEKPTAGAPENGPASGPAAGPITPPAPAAPIADTARAAPEFGNAPGGLPDTAPDAETADGDDPDSTPPPDEPAPPAPGATPAQEPQR